MAPHRQGELRRWDRAAVERLAWAMRSVKKGCPGASGNPAWAAGPRSSAGRASHPLRVHCQWPSALCLQQYSLYPDPPASPVLEIDDSEQTPRNSESGLRAGAAPGLQGAPNKSAGQPIWTTEGRPKDRAQGCAPSKSSGWKITWVVPSRYDPLLARLKESSAVAP